MKKGYDFQELVGEVLRAFNPGAEVKVGEWIEGPDGRRDMDVAIVGEMDGKRKFLLIECKDYTYAKTPTPVGIPEVDAFESKCRDLGVDARAIASNSGFTKPAIRKCARVGIVPIAALMQGDARAKAKILTTIYLRKIRQVQVPLPRFIYHHPPDAVPVNPPPIQYRDMQLQGEPIDPWLLRQAMIFQVFHPWLQKPIHADFNFKQPMMVTNGDIQFLVSKIEVRFHWETRWFRQVIELDAGAAFYEYLHDRVVFTPGANQYTFKGLNFDTAEPCDAPTKEEYRLMPRQAPRDQAFEMGFVMFQGVPIDDPPPVIPSAIEAAIRPEDLNATFTDIPFDAIDWPQPANLVGRPSDDHVTNRTVSSGGLTP